MTLSVARDVVLGGLTDRARHGIRAALHTGGQRSTGCTQLVHGLGDDTSDFRYGLDSLLARLGERIEVRAELIELCIVRRQQITELLDVARDGGAVLRDRADRAFRVGEGLHTGCVLSGTFSSSWTRYCSCQSSRLDRPRR